MKFLERGIKGNEAMFLGLGATLALLPLARYLVSCFTHRNSGYGSENGSRTEVASSIIYGRELQYELRILQYYEAFKTVIHDTSRLVLGLKDEIDHLRNENEELRQEKLDLERRWESAQRSLSTLGRLQAEANSLGEANDELETQIGQLQTNHDEKAEELILLEWLNAKLSYELAYNQPPPGKTKVPGHCPSKDLMSRIKQNALTCLRSCCREKAARATKKNGV